jgi:hypothetical protein
MTMWPVSPQLNSPKNDAPELLEPVVDADGLPTSVGVD